MQELEKIAAFGAFFDFLENPSKFKQIIEDAKKVTKESLDVIEKQRRIKEVDTWKASQMAEVSRQFDALEKMDAAHLENIEALAVKVAAHKKSVSDANKRSRDREEAINVRENAVQDLEKQKAKLDQIAEEYAAKMANLKADKERLKEDIAKIKAAAGGLS
jgi:DNA repair ATPase RecN